MSFLTGKPSKEAQAAQFAKLYGEAMAAGRAAALGTTPVPMVVREVDPITNATIHQYEPIADGACGFAWVNVKPGTSAFARWLKETGKAHTDSYAGGVQIWIGDYNQSAARKEAHADAMAKVFRAHNIQAYAGSRLD